MPTTFRYGLDARLDFDFPPGVLIAACIAPQADKASNVMMQVRESLDRPCGYPPLAQAVVPGDKVVVALEAGVPENDSIVAAIVQCVMQARGSAAEVTVLRTRADAEAQALDPRRILPPEVRDAVRLETHDPDQRGQLGYLANTAKGRPIYLNRVLCDADLVVLVGCLRPSDAIAYHGVHGSLYPTFSDAKTQQRFRHPGLVDHDAELLARARGEVKRVGWLAGTQFTIQVVPGPDDTLLEVFAGEAQAVYRLGQPRCQTAWEHTVPQRASLVIAALAGGAAQQTWENVGRALAGALRVVADDGVIALCTELSAAPGPAMQGLVNVEDLYQALSQIRKQRLVDSVPAIELAEALQRTRVYLLSQLDETVIEELGMAAVTDPQDLVRLARRHPTCILLPDAQYTLATAAEDLVE